MFSETNDRRNVLVRLENVLFAFVSVLFWLVASRLPQSDDSEIKPGRNNNKAGYHNCRPMKVND